MLGCALALAARRPRVFALVVAADLAGQGLATAVKAAVDRRRPDLRPAHLRTLIPEPHSSSFPSGHATASFACAVVLGACAPRLAPAFLALAAAIAYSRVYVGVHYPLDVVAGALLGSAAATALLWLAAGRRRSRRSTRRG